MNLTLGQYYRANSFIHSLDPRTKIAVTAIYILAVFLAKGVWGYSLCFLFTITELIFSKVPLTMAVRALKTVIAIIFFTVIFNLFFINTGTELFRWHFISITTDGLSLTLKLCVRLMLLVVGSGFLTFTTTPIALTDGLESILSPLRVIKFPVHETALMMSIALRFIPTLAQELDKIKKAQLSRGADFESGGIIKRAKGMLPLLVPLFVSSFRRADELAQAMEARCYRGGKGRTKLNVLKAGKRDAIAYIFAFAVLLTIVVGQI
ncbi:MAG: energy-coupling factor transporter transmembrane protein EcfT [Firmicutes bacterium]|nr:energy-coupling factor transporter transmembrane protein EcfT [Bacillota bacterium]